MSYSQQEFVAKPPRDYEKNPAKTALYFEIGGNAGLYSLNAERIWLYKDQMKLSTRIGLNVIPHSYYLYQTYLAEQNIVLFKNPHHLECGLGITIQRQYNGHCLNPTDYFWENVWYGATRLGYRYQKQDDGLFLKVGLTPVVFQKSDCGFNTSYTQIWGGIAIGVSF